jgi:hypothetical protein
MQNEISTCMIFDISIGSERNLAIPRVLLKPCLIFKNVISVNIKLFLELNVNKMFSLFFGGILENGQSPLDI